MLKTAVVNICLFKGKLFLLRFGVIVPLRQSNFTEIKRKDSFNRVENDNTTVVQMMSLFGWLECMVVHISVLLKCKEFENLHCISVLETLIHVSEEN